jgi:hypothetical protein
VRELGEAGLAGRGGLYFFVTKEELLTLLKAELLTLP